MKRAIALILSVSLALASTGCATLLRGTSQTVTVKTMPAGRSVLYQGQELADGEMVMVQKHFDPPRFYVGQVPVDMTYDPDPLLLGDAVLLLFFVVPGLVALGIDFGTGAWRNLHETQTLPVPDSAATSGPSSRAPENHTANASSPDAEPAPEVEPAAAAEPASNVEETPDEEGAPQQPVSRGSQEPSTAEPTAGLVGTAFQEPAADPATSTAGSAPGPEGTSLTDLTAFTNPDRAGTLSLRGGLGFTLGPDTLLLATEGDYFVNQNIALGPLLQFGVSGNRLILAPTFNVRGVFDLPVEELERLKPFVQGGMGFAYLHRDNRPGDDDDIGFLLNFGFGGDFYVTDNLSLGSSMLFNIMPDEVLGENFFFSWQFLSASFHF